MPFLVLIVGAIGLSCKSTGHMQKGLATYLSCAEPTLHTYLTLGLHWILLLLAVRELMRLGPIKDSLGLMQVRSY